MDSVATQQFVSVYDVLQHFVVEVADVRLAAGKRWSIVKNPGWMLWPTARKILPIVQFIGQQRLKSILIELMIFPLIESGFWKV